MTSCCSLNKPGCVGETLSRQPHVNKIWNLNYSINVRVKVISIGVIWKGFNGRVCMQNIKYRCLWNTNAPLSPTWPLTLTFDLLTWKSIGIIYSWRTIYLPSLKLLGQSVLELSVAQGKGYRHTDRPTYRPTDRQVQRNMPLLFQRGA